MSCCFPGACCYVFDYYVAPFSPTLFVVVPPSVLFFMYMLANTVCQSSVRTSPFTYYPAF